MTFEEYEQGYYSGDSEDNSGPPEDPETHAMVELLVEFETEMYRLDCRRRIQGLNRRHLESLLVDLHGEEWRDAL